MNETELMMIERWEELNVKYELAIITDNEVALMEELELELIAHYGYEMRLDLVKIE